MRESTYYHTGYQDTIDVIYLKLIKKLNDMIENLKVDVIYFKEHYRKQVETDRYVRKKALKLEKKNKIIETELKDIIK